MQITLTGYADLISIHALREEGDEFIDFILEALSNFYPRPPRGGRLLRVVRPHNTVVFLSTPSARRATSKEGKHHDSVEISIHALREEGDLLKRKIIKKLLIFLSTPSARRATEIPYSQYTVKEFLSTPSARRATSRQMVQSLTTLISIHALREEGDLSGSGGQQSMANFYPRPPRGGRPQRKRRPTEHGKFLSTPSARRATASCWMRL